MSALRLLAVRSASLCARAAVRPALPARSACASVLLMRPLHCWAPRLMAVDPTAAPPALAHSEVQARVLDVVRKFEKIKDPNTVTASSSFKELGA